MGQLAHASAGACGRGGPALVDSAVRGASPIAFAVAASTADGATPVVPGVPFRHATAPNSRTSSNQREPAAAGGEEAPDPTLLTADIARTVAGIPATVASMLMT